MMFLVLQEQEISSPLLKVRIFLRIHACNVDLSSACLNKLRVQYL